MEKELKILFAEDLHTDFELAVREIEKAGISVEAFRVDTEEDFRRALEVFKPHIVISDYSMPLFDADEALKICQELDPFLPFIVLTGSINEETAVNCLKSGATDYILKESLKRLPFAVREAMASFEIQSQKEEYLNKLKESEHRLRQAHKIARIGNWEFDFNSGMVTASDEARMIYGVEESTLPIAEVQAMVLIQYRSALDRAMNEHKEFGKPYDVEFKIRRRNDGEIRYIHSMGEYNSETNKLIGIITDITEQKINQQLRQEIFLAIEAANFKRDFIAHISHEIRTPLTAIEGVSELIEQTKLSEIQKDYLETLKFSIESLRTIINEVLDFSKIEAGQIRINPVAFDSEEIAEKSEKLFNSICKKPLKFQVEGFDKLPKIIKADKQRVFQIITNLISNAVKYSKEGTVKLSVLLDDVIEEDKFLFKILVQDNGPGIHANLKEKLFKPFSQVHENTENVHIEGTGLGLSICKDLANLLGGEIGVESDPGKGSVFWFTFVAEAAESEELAAEVVEENPNHESSKRLKILLAEDKAVNTKVITLMLNSLGHEVVDVNNGKQAVERCKKEKFDLVLMDVQMPVMDGIEATRKIKEECSDPPPVIGLSANAMEGDREKYMKAGMDNYLIKPIKTNDIAKAIKNLKI